MTQTHQGHSEQIKIALAVAVPSAVIFLALISALFWKNHRNKLRIKDLRAGIEENPPSWDAEQSPPAIANSKNAAFSEFGSPDKRSTHYQYFDANAISRLKKEVYIAEVAHELTPATEPQRPVELDGAPLKF